MSFLQAGKHKEQVQSRYKTWWNYNQKNLSVSYGKWNFFCPFMQLSIDFKYCMICSMHRFVPALGISVPLFCDLHLTHKQQHMNYTVKMFFSDTWNLFIGRNQNKPLWSGNIIVPFRFHFHEAYNTAPVNHLFVLIKMVFPYEKQTHHPL